MVATAAAEGWGGLHQDFLILIAEKIKLIEDFACFGMVCKSWNEAASITNLLQPQIPWLILAAMDDDQHNNICGRGRRQIYSLSNKKVIGRNNLYFPSERRCIGLDHGWILTISKLSGDMNLLHPHSGSEIELPNQTSIEAYYDFRTWPSYTFTRKAALSGNPSSESSSSDLTLMIIHSGGSKLGYWKPGDTCWTSFDVISRFHDLIYHKDQFYAISYDGIIWACSIIDDHDHHDHHQQTGVFVLRQITMGDVPILPNMFGVWPYIVKSTSPDVLLIVVREEEYEDGPNFDEMEAVGVDEEGGKLYEDKYLNYGLVGFKVYEVDLINRGCPKQIMNMGDKAIFVGDNTSVSFVASQYIGIKANHIYFTDDFDEWYLGIINGGGRSMGCYCLEDAKITQFDVDETRSRISPPFWFIPSL